jgi:Raf kinase inhibitor-like YbhB/YbcL family protein
MAAGLAACGDDEGLPYERGTIALESPAFPAGGAIPRRHAHADEGADVSPPLRWSGVPANAKELVIVVEDSDAPSRVPFAHWLVYGIPPSVATLPEGIAPGVAPVEAAGGALQGTNDFGEPGWGGPLPPAGDPAHRYRFWLYALGSPSGLEPGSKRARVIEALKGRTIGSGRLIGTYERKR